MNLQIKSRNQYANKVQAIRKKLNTYTHSSFLNQLYIHFQSLRNPQNGLVSNFPWCCFLALKWKYLGDVSSEARDINDREFDKIINRIYALQNDASDLHQMNSIELEIRRMIISQMFYQTPAKAHMHALARQFLWFCGSDSPWFRDNFLAQTGIRLQDYYLISFHLLTHNTLTGRTESLRIPLRELIIPLSPALNMTTLKNYLSLLSLYSEDLTSFFSRYACDGPLASEYFEDTPLIKKPFLMDNEHLCVFSRTLLLQALTSAVPRLFSEFSPTPFKDKFGPVLESYLEDYIRKVFPELISEKDIALLYRKNSTEGKKVDYILPSNEGYVFIDSKAIEPHGDVKTSVSPVHLRGKLRSSFEKGIIQAQECCKIMNTINKRSRSELDAVLIVVHRDHFISTGNFLNKNISTELFSDIEEKYGYLPVNRERIYYLTIDELEHLIDICEKKMVSVISVINQAVADDAQPHRQKMNFGMHLQAISPASYLSRTNLHNSYLNLIKMKEAAVQQSEGFWDGRVEIYLRALHFLTSRP
ncbi:hypothetical protein [Pantoea coffeiphila]|uniref:GapS1 family protein n=1 Tax=Pantoea coffeiphila TaxID=1465635 RepID=UPI00195FE5BF|nr:hypothetical protein [Pantoea coffeiphila]MBM7345050.1 hypothetical protein [Pantoea coffeiphila]